MAFGSEFFRAVCIAGAKCFAGRESLCGVSRESESHFYFMVCYLLTEAAIARTGGDAASLQDIETERTGEERKRKKRVVM
jgi:hypothetical protein